MTDTNSALDPQPQQAPATLRASFVARFGEAAAEALLAAAREHTNGVHDREGSDPLRWAVFIAIGYECLEKPSYREHHGITTPTFEEFQAWAREPEHHAALMAHDGDVDYLALFAGAYHEFFGWPNDVEIEAGEAN